MPRDVVFTDGVSRLSESLEEIAGAAEDPSSLEAEALELREGELVRWGWDVRRECCWHWSFSNASFW